MGKTITYGTNRPTKKDVDWFINNVGPCTHDLFSLIMGEGWHFIMVRNYSLPIGVFGDNEWFLIVEDEKKLVHWLLVR
jgi:hypothetical protein